MGCGRFPAPLFVRGWLISPIPVLCGIGGFLLFRFCTQYTPSLARWCTCSPHFRWWGPWFACQFVLDSVVKIFTFKMPVIFWRWKFNFCLSMSRSMPVGVAVLSVVAVATPEMIRNLASLMMRGRFPCFPPYCLVFTEFALRASWLMRGSMRQGLFCRESCWLACCWGRQWHS